MENHNKQNRITMKNTVTAFLLASLSLAAAAEKPVKVYILSGQSNMVGIGQISSGGTRWGDEFSDIKVSVYEGAYDAEADYEALKPLKTEVITKFGGVEPAQYPKGGTQVSRGFFAPKETGVYQFNPGYQDSSNCVMTVNGVEVHRKQPDGQEIKKSIKLNAGEKVPFRIIHFKENGRGLGWHVRMDVPGTLTTIVKEEGGFPYLIDQDQNWVTRDDVWYKGVVTATANQWLAPGCGAGSSQIGPELGFGHMVGNFHDEPVLILKASQGNRSLAWDFLPPGSERYEIGETIYAGYKDSPASWPKGTEPQPIDWYAGKQYDDCVNAAKEVLANFDQSFPHWKGRKYEIAGFVWFQGHKDTGSEVTAARYEQNLVTLIKALRKDFDAPSAPFVVATGCGNKGREGNGLTVAEAQLAVDGDKGKYPEFKGNVKSVDTRDFFPDPEKSPKNQDFHYHQNAGAYMRIGEAMGKGMLELLEK
jgi:alpha-galactosidase